MLFCENKCKKNTRLPKIVWKFEKIENISKFRKSAKHIFSMYDTERDDTTK